MLDQFLAVAYEDQTEKTAQDALISRMRTLPTDVVEKIAFGGILESAKCGDEPRCWLDNFKGTPLFEKAVELERAEIQLEQQDIQQRMQSQSQEVWTKRDALRLQKKMLELDLAVEGAGGGAAVAPPAAGGSPEAEEEQGIALLEQAQAQEEAAGEGNSPEEKQENDAIAELHAAHGEGAPPAKGKEEEGKPPAKAPPKPPAKKEEPEAEPKKKEEAAVKVASAIEAGRLLAKVAVEIPGAAVLGGLFGASKAHQRKENPAGGAVRGAIGAQGGLELGGAFGGLGGKALAHKLKMDTTTGGNIGRAAGAIAGSVGGFKALTRDKKKEASVAELREAAAKTAGIGSALMGTANGAKSLVGTAYKAGGLGQVAKSVGNVATGFAKANPLAAAGTAAGAGLLAGRLSKGNAQQT